MLPRMLGLFLLLLLLLLVAAKLKVLGRPSPPSAATSPAPAQDLTLTRSAADHGAIRGPALPATVPPLDSIARTTVRVRLSAEPDRHYLDSLLAVSDSVIRHWPVTTATLPYAIVRETPPGFVPEMIHDARWALDSWSPAGVGLQFVETEDTSEAVLILRWTDSLVGERAGFTDLTWDRAGRIRHAEVQLSTRSPTSGRSLPLPVRRAVALHEIGHALGMPHSADTADAMYPIASATEPSPRDRFTLRLLYQLPTGWVGVGIRPEAVGVGEDSL